LRSHQNKEILQDSFINFVASTQIHLYSANLILNLYKSWHETGSDTERNRHQSTHAGTKNSQKY